MFIATSARRQSIKSEFRPRTLELHSEMLDDIGPGFIPTSPQRIKSKATIKINCANRTRSAYGKKVKQMVDFTCL